MKRQIGLLRDPSTALYIALSGAPAQSACRLPSMKPTDSNAQAAMLGNVAMPTKDNIFTTCYGQQHAQALSVREPGCCLTHSTCLMMSSCEGIFAFPVTNIGMVKMVDWTLSVDTVNECEAAAIVAKLSLRKAPTRQQKQRVVSPTMCPKLLPVWCDEGLSF